MPGSRPHPPHSLGRWGEARAEEHLRSRGWRILARNYRFGRREVDVVARKGDVVAFVEVKTRAGEGFGSPEAALTALKRREIEIVAGEYLVRHRLEHLNARFDVFAVLVGQDRRVVRVEHLEDAWRPGWP